MARCPSGGRECRLGNARGTLRHDIHCSLRYPDEDLALHPSGQLWAKVPLRKAIAPPNSRRASYVFKDHPCILDK